MTVIDLFGQEEELVPEEPDPPRRQGRYAEFMVCAYLTKLGYHVLHVDTAGFDLILEYEDESYRVDVKSSGRIYRGKRRVTCIWHTRKNTKYRRMVGDKVVRAGVQRDMTPKDADLLALFHEEFEAVVFYPVLRPTKLVCLPASQVQEDRYGERSLKAAIEALSKGRGGWNEK